MADGRTGNVPMTKERTGPIGTVRRRYVPVRTSSDLRKNRTGTRYARRYAPAYRTGGGYVVPPPVRGPVRVGDLKINKETTTMHDDTRPTPDHDPARARDFGMLLTAARLAGPLVLCGGCGRPCAECDDGCNDALATWTNRPAA